MERSLARLGTNPRVRAAEHSVRENDGETISAQIALSEIPAPPFEEEARGLHMAELFRQAGLHDVRLDGAGNVLAHLGGRAEAGARPGEAPLVVSAHLDTVFPAGTDVAVERRGDLLRGPGISDDARGLATLVATARALVRSGLSTSRPLLFAATVGEEGLGDLRGVKQLFSEGGAGAGAGGFISLDGAGLERIVVRGLGSRRFRVSARGPGGHSWVDWGTPNPIHTLGGIAHALSQHELSVDPPTTLTIARWGGGTSINAIPQTAWIEIDTRSESDERLAELEAWLRQTVADHALASPEELALDVEMIGHRPGGGTPPDTDLVEAALAATRAQRCQPHLALSSTDANIPMSRGVPAITIGCGGEAGKAHTTDEWYRNVRGADGVVRALHTILLAAGVPE